MKNEQIVIAELIRLCEKKMTGRKSRLPKKLKKLVKRYMRLRELNAIIISHKQNVFMREDGTIFTTKTLLPI